MSTQAMLADHQARARITTSGLAETLFVEAGAGTGKTKQLVDRVVNLVLEGQTRLRSIAAITFTEAAATELRDRIRVELERRALDGSDDVRAGRARQALAEADQAAFTTLHGFALRILNEHPISAGLPPRVQIADEISSELAFEDRWVRFVDALYADQANEELLIRAALLNVPLEPSANRATLKDVAAILQQSWDRLEELATPDEDPPPLPALDFGGFDSAVAALEAVTVECRKPGDKLLGLIVEALPLMRQIVDMGDPHQKLQWLEGREWKNSNWGDRLSWHDVDRARRLYKAVTEQARAVRDVAVNAVLERFLVLIATELWNAAEARRLEGTLEFHDLLVLARRALRRSAPTRRALSERFSCLLLDEFQDTDPLQIELAVLIAGAIGDSPPPSWREADVPAGRLFFVGDPKQSIYRFRRADIRLFLNARDAFSHGAPVRLSTNFRTVAPIIVWINELFARLMPEEVANQQPKYEPLDAHRRPSADDVHKVVLIGGGLDQPAGEVRAAEAAHVAAVVADVRAHPGRWPVLDDGGEWRPARLGDVAILLPTRTSLPFLRARLDAAAIPYRLDTGTLVFDTQEIRDLVAVVRAIADATDTVSLVAALRSPLYACSDVDLATWRSAGGPWDLGRPAPEQLKDHPVGRAINHLHEMWTQRWWLTPSALLARLERDLHPLLTAFGDERPKDVWRRVRFLLDQARAFDASQGGGLRAFCRWAELQASSSSRVHEPVGADTDSDAVRILTVHGAKGLEFPITVLSGLTTQPLGQRAGAGVVWPEDAEGGGKVAIKLGKDRKTDNFDPRAEVEDQMGESEWLRLLYVAVTRARDHLVVSAYHTARGKRSYGRLVWEQMHAHEHLLRAAVPPPDEATATAAVELPTPPTASMVEAATSQRRQWIAARGDLLQRVKVRRFASATAIAGDAAAEPELPFDDNPDAAETGDVDVTADHLGLDDDDQHRTAFRRGRAGTAVGRAVHATLQSVDLAIDPADALIDEIAAREAAGEALPEAAGTVAAMVRSALRSDAIALARAHLHHKEIYVAAPVGNRVIEGYVDVLVETPEGLVVVDYKTDTVRSEAEVDGKLARYELQGAAYATALEASTGLPVIACRFVFCRPGGAIERQVADLPAARRRVISALASEP